VQEREWARDEGERDLELKEKSFDVVAIKKNKYRPPLWEGNFLVGCDYVVWV
jgi:hypothetical protein